MSKHTVVTMDLRQSVPSKRRRGWKLQREVMATNGTVLAADFRRKASAIRINPNLKGWYQVAIGLYNPDTFVTGVNVKLSSDSFFDFVQCSSYEECPEEVVFKSANLTGQELILGQPDGYSVYIDYVKFTPVQPQATRKSRWKVGAINDFFSLNYDQLFKGAPADIERCVWLHREAGFNVMYWLAAGGSCFYRTRVGSMNMPDSRERTQPFNWLIEKHNVIRLARKQCEKAGMAFYPWFRINNEYGGAIKFLGKSVASKFWLEHPEFRAVDRNGKKTLYWLSFAYPEVREYKLALAKEMVSWGASGIFIDTQRHPPMTQYAPAAVNSFRKIHGDDPRRLPEDDERWLRHKSSFFTEFMRALRVEITRIDPQMRIALRVSLHPGKCLKEGVDVEALVKENLVDELIPSSHCYFNFLSLKPFESILKGSRCTVYGGINPYLPRGEDPGVNGEPVWPMRKPLYASGADFLAQAEQFRREGASGVALYESEAIITRPGIRRAIQTLVRS